LPWNIGSHYSFFWICYITVLVLGVVINAATFVFMVVNKNLKHLSSVQVVKYLVAEDFFSALTCLIQCSLNYNVRSLFGDSVGCIIEAWQVGFFISITGYSLGLISYIVRVNVTAHTKHTQRKRRRFILKAHVVFWIAGAIFATGSTVWPGSSRLNSSGTYCIAAFEKAWPAFFFFGVAVFPTVVFLIVQYAWIFIYVYQSKKEIEKDNATEDSHTRYHFKLARQLGSLVVVYFIFYLPFLASAIYEWSTGYYAPPFVDGAGVLVHIASVANPVMYLWTSSHAKKEISKLWTDVSESLNFQSNHSDQSTSVPTQEQANP